MLFKPWTSNTSTQPWPLDMLSPADWLLADGKKKGWIPQEQPTVSHRGAQVTFWPCRWHLSSADISPTMARWDSRKILEAKLQNLPSPHTMGQSGSALQRKQPWNCFREQGKSSCSTSGMLWRQSRYRLS